MSAILRVSPRTCDFGPHYKPTGIPRVNWGHPLLQGIASLTFDTGLGFYAQLFNNGYPLVNVNSLFAGFGSNVSLPTFNTPFGSACRWSGSVNQNQSNGVFEYVDPPSGLSNVQNLSFLSNRPAGAGMTFFCAGMVSGTGNLTFNGVVYGRAAVPDNGTPSNEFSWGFQQVASSSAMQAWYLTSSGSPYSTSANTQIGSNFDPGVGNLFTLVCSMINTSSGGAYSAVTSGTFYGNGVQQGSTVTGLNCPTMANSSGFGGLNNQETQVQHGGWWHLVSVHSAFNFMQGASFIGGVVGRTWSAADALQFHQRPFAFLYPSQLSMPTLHK